MANQHDRQFVLAVMYHFHEPFQSLQGFVVKVMGFIHKQHHRLFLIFDQLFQALFALFTLAGNPDLLLGRS